MAPLLVWISLVLFTPGMCSVEPEMHKMSGAIEALTEHVHKLQQSRDRDVMHLEAQKEHLKVELRKKKQTNPLVGKEEKSRQEGDSRAEESC